jgi:hypothetical protein
LAPGIFIDYVYFPAGLPGQFLGYFSHIEYPAQGLALGEDITGDHTAVCGFNFRFDGNVKNKVYGLDPWCYNNLGSAEKIIDHQQKQDYYQAGEDS